MAVVTEFVFVIMAKVGLSCYYLLLNLLLLMVVVAEEEEEEVVVEVELLALDDDLVELVVGV